MIDKTLRDFERHLSGLSTQTKRAYLNDLEQWFEKMGEFPISEKKIQKAVLFFIENYDKRTLSRKISSLKKYLKFIGFLEGVNLNSLFPKIKFNEKKPVFENSKSLEKFFDNLPKSSPVDIRNYCLFYLMFSTGMRVSEIVNLKCFKEVPDTLLIRSKGSKDRLIFFGPKTKIQLFNYIQKSRPLLEKGHSPDLLFLSESGRKMNDRSVRKILKKCLLVTDLRMDFHPHSFRHSFATHLLNSGLDLRVIQEILGHKNLSTTAKYTQVGLEKIRDELEKKHPLNTNKSI